MILLVTSTATFAPLASPSRVHAAGGLVAALAFNEGAGATAGDASGNGNSGTIGTAAWTTQGRFGSALSFNGTSARVTVADSASLRLTSAMTLEAWVNPTTVTNAWRDVLVKGNDDYYLMATSTNTSRPVGAAIVAGTKQRAIGTAALIANTWTHLAVTYDGSAVRLFVNGSQVSSTPASGSIATSALALGIGGDAIHGQFFAGRIDEVRIYNAALSAAQIQTDMTTPITAALRVRGATIVQNSSPSPRAITRTVFQRIAVSIRRSLRLPAILTAST